MPAKRKRDILEGFDPNQSDPEDENFDPSEARPAPRSTKKSRGAKSRGRTGGSRRRANKYGGSDIEDDEELSDSEQEHSFGEDFHEEESDSDLPVNATGRRIRKAAVKHQSYKESSVDDSDSDGAVQDSDSDVRPAPKKSRIVVLKTDPKGRRAKAEPKNAPPPPTRRSTRARTEETEETLLELSNSGKHALKAGSKSPEAAIGHPRATRGAKGIKKPPTPIHEATQESETNAEPEPAIEEVDEMAGDIVEEPEEAENVDEDANLALDGTNDDNVDEPMEDAPEEEQGAENQAAEDGDDDEDEDDAPLTRRTRSARTAAKAPPPAEEAVADEADPDSNPTGRRAGRKLRRREKKSMQEPSSDFEPGEESAEENLSGSDAGNNKGANAVTADESSTPTPARGRSTRGRGGRKGRRSRHDSGDEEVELDKDEMAEELEELRESSRSRLRRTRRRSPSIQYEERTTKTRRTKPVNYSIPAIDPAALEADDDDEPAQTPARRRGGKTGSSQLWERNFNSTYGPFGGGGGAGSLLSGPWGTGATGGVDSDSSDDEMVQRSGLGGMVGMTPTSAAPPVGLFGGVAQSHNADGIGGIGGATPNVGKVKNQKAYADADPLGVDLSVDFTKVGGLQGHIDQLKEMVQLPLLYPELFQKFHVTPPRGVLFHGPPGTGKTLLARALANSVGSGGRKISFYMRKGADALSKWVGEAEKQLRLLFEEARRTQPSIIFFDEIDGLAPVRSSKQEQIHASIVSTLLALMDGMDGRGQVIVIGATNRPDNIDPALRRPGRFDREFYFPLPDFEGRRSILDIHTEGWGISDQFKNALAENTKGYGGADLRALCTEAALNSIQRTYPQIYSSKEKLIVDPDKITIHATDFMLSVKKMVPSSERSATSSATPIPRFIEPLLRNQFKAVLEVLNNILPRHKKTTALEEAMYEPYHDADHGFGREAMHQEFERSRIFRPRLLLSGVPGMGQNYLAAAILHHLEGVHVQNFDLATLLGDGRPLEQVIVSLFTEVRRHKPSVIYIPTVDAWWASLGDAALTTFTTMLRNIPPADPVLLLATSETLPEAMAPEILKELFGFSKKNRAIIERPPRELRIEFFENIVAHIRKSPAEFPNPLDRKKRVLEILPVAPPPPPRQLTKEEVKAQRKVDLHHLNLLKMRLQPIMDQIHRKYRKFRQPVIPMSQIAYLFNDADPNYVRPDIAEGENRPYELSKDVHGVPGIKDMRTGKFFYNLETTTIEERLANGFYARPIDFYDDINRLYHDAKNIGDRDRTLKANELRTNVEVDVHDIAATLANQGIRFDEIYQRQKDRYKELEERVAKKAAFQPMVDMIQSDLMADEDSDSQGPVGIGLPIPRGSQTTTARFLPIMSPRSGEHGNSNSTGSQPLTNGTSDPSRHGEDTQMGGIDYDTQVMPASQRTSMGPPLRWQSGSRPLGDSTRVTVGTQLSQRSAITSVPTGVSPSAIPNDASTTKTSDPSTNRGAVSREWSTQHTNGYHNSNPEENSQLLDTQLDSQPQSGNTGDVPSQSTSSGRDWAHSQAAGIAQGLIQPRGGMFTGGSGGGVGAPGVGGVISETESPTSSQKPSGGSGSGSGSGSGLGSGGGGSGSGSRKSVLDNILNEDTVNLTATTTSSSKTGVSSQSRSSQQPIIHEGQLREFLNTVADRTAGCSIEQLEQINRELMDEIWRSRNEWNRMVVLSSLITVFNDTVGDIEAVQGTFVSPAVQEKKSVAASGGAGGAGGSRTEKSLVVVDADGDVSVDDVQGQQGQGEEEGEDDAGEGGEGEGDVSVETLDTTAGVTVEEEQFIYLR